MSSYDERNIAQIRLDEMIVKYERRAKEAKEMALRYKPDDELAKQLNLLIADLKELKLAVNVISKKGGKIANKC